MAPAAPRKQLEEVRAARARAGCDSASATDPSMPIPVAPLRKRLFGKQPVARHGGLLRRESTRPLQDLSGPLHEHTCRNASTQQKKRLLARSEHRELHEDVAEDERCPAETGTPSDLLASVAIAGAVGVALAAATSVPSSGPRVEHDRPARNVQEHASTARSEAAGIAAAAAGKRIREAEARGIGNAGKISKLQSMTAGPGEDEQFGTRARFKLRLALEQSRKRSGASSAATQGVDEELATQDGSNLQGPPHDSGVAPGDVEANVADGCVVAALPRCSSCFRTGHADCSSHLCDFTPCCFCLSIFVTTHADSQICQEVQRLSGCHTCGREDCFSSSLACCSRTGSLTADDVGIRPSLVDLMEDLTGRILDDKPRAFLNAAPIWGRGSCYISAGLQVLFSSLRVQMLLAQIVSRQKPDSDVWNFCTQTSIAGIQACRRQQDLSDKTLATTFAACMQGSDQGGTSLRGQPLYPALFLRECYSGAQEDSSLFLMTCLQSCHETKQIFRGSFRPAVLSCSACGHQSTAGSHADERIFITLQIESRCRDSGVQYDSVQDAVNASFTETLPETFSGFCDNCKQRWSHKCQPVERPPTALILQVKRWAAKITPDRKIVYERLSSTMRLDEEIVVENLVYDLKGIVFHHGPTPDGGHYAAVARHGGRLGAFYVYNDACRRSLDPIALTCDARLPGSWASQAFHATTLLYEQRCDVDPQM